METSIPVALSAQLSMEKRLETLSHNLANARTVGFRAEEVRFQEILSRTGPDPVSFASKGETFISRQSGEHLGTGNALDVAVNGDAFLAFQAPEGLIYTRDGRMQISPDGELQTLTGRPYADAGGAPIVVDPAGGPITIDRNGGVSQRGIQIGAIGLFSLPANANLTRYDTSGVRSDRPGEPVIDFINNSVSQGYVEAANVNPILEMSRLIDIQRTFESASRAVETNDRTLSQAIQALGSSR